MTYNQTYQNTQPNYSPEYLCDAIADVLDKGKRRRNKDGGWDGLSCPICGGSDCLSADPGREEPVVIICRSTGCDGGQMKKILREQYGIPIPGPAGENDRFFTAEERAREIKARREREEKERQAQDAAARKAARKATRIFGEALPVTEPTPYLLKKQFTGDALKTLAQASAIRRDGDDLLLALYNELGELTSIQTIRPDGDKRLFKGCRKQGCFHPIGIRPEDIPNLRALPEAATLHLVEGWATGGAVYLSTGHPAIVTNDAGNMPEVARVIRALAPEAEIILCADDDETPDKPGNAGIEKAVDAARAVGGKVAYPRPELPAEGRKIDFWDVWHEAGPEAVKRAVDAAQVPDAPEEESAPADEAEAFERELDRLAALSTLEYERQRQGAAKRFGVSVTRLDKLVKERKSDAGKSGATIKDESIVFPEVEPCLDTVNPWEVAESLRVLFRRFVATTDESFTVLVLWVMVTWLGTNAPVKVFTYLLITSPTKECGKSTLLELLGRLVYRPFQASNISAAVLYRLIANYHPTTLLDEIDAWLKGDNAESIRGLIDSGYANNDLASAWRVEKGRNGEMILKRFDVRGYKVFAGIKKPSDTIVSRSIVVKMRRLKPGETVEDLLCDTEETLFATVKSQLARLALDYREAFVEAQRNIDFPPSLRGRKKDVWRSVLAAADIVGGPWPELARLAATSVSGAEEVQNDRTTRLLSNIQTIFQELGNPERIGSTELVEKLNECKEWEWHDYRHGQGIEANTLARLLNGIQTAAGEQIASSKMRIPANGGDSRMGYRLADFEDAFARYLSFLDPTPPPQAGTPEQSSKISKLPENLSRTVPEQSRNKMENDAGQVGQFRPCSGTVPDEKRLNILKSLDCSGVPAETPPRDSENENEGEEEECRTY